MVKEGRIVTYENLPDLTSKMLKHIGYLSILFLGIWMG
jgi:hypothetical protein